MVVKCPVDVVLSHPECRKEVSACRLPELRKLTCFLCVLVAYGDSCFGPVWLKVLTFSYRCGQLK